MGRWSRPLGRAFLEWLAPERGAHWLEVGCGTGSLTSNVCALADPASVTACDPSNAFVGYARQALGAAPVTFETAGADALPIRDGGFDWVVSGLVLNFIPEPARALEAMRERTKKGGAVAAYVWHYAGGIEFLRHFWDEAVRLEPAAQALDEGRRFPLCEPAALASLFESAGFARVATDWIQIPTHFRDFDDYWTPFLGGTGPAPSYVLSLAPERRELLCERLRERLSRGEGAGISLTARAIAVRGAVA
jgi:ubiquinone/menaquinone biosynthesis C-methylase UbiE